jgi:hypothetical protein
MDALEIKTPIVSASDLNASGSQTELLVNLCRVVNATTYLSGPGGRRYMDLTLFDQANIEVRFQEFSSPQYPQVFPRVPFVPDLAVVDAIFSCGTAAKEFLR